MLSSLRKSMGQKGEISLTLALLGIFITVLGIGLGSISVQQAQTNRASAQLLPGDYPYHSVLELRNEYGDIIAWQEGMTWENIITNGSNPGLSNGDIKPVGCEGTCPAVLEWNTGSVPQELRGSIADVVLRMPPGISIVEPYCTSSPRDNCEDTTIDNDGTRVSIRRGMRIESGADLVYGLVIRGGTPYEESDPTPDPDPTADPDPDPNPGATGNMEVRVVALNYPQVTRFWDSDHATSRRPASCSRQGLFEQKRPLYLSDARIRAQCVGGGCDVGSYKDVRMEKRAGFLTFTDLEPGQYELDIVDDDILKRGFEEYSGCHDVRWTVEAGRTNQDAIMMLANLPNGDYETKTTEKLCKDEGGQPNLIQGINNNLCYYSGGRGGGGGEPDPGEPDPGEPGPLQCGRKCVYSEQKPGEGVRCWTGACPSNRPNCGGDTPLERVQNINQGCMYAGNACGFLEEVRCADGGPISGGGGGGEPDPGPGGGGPPFPPIPEVPEEPIPKTQCEKEGNACVVNANICQAEGGRVIYGKGCNGTCCRFPAPSESGNGSIKVSMSVQNYLKQGQGSMYFKHATCSFTGQPGDGTLYSVQDCGKGPDNASLPALTANPPYYTWGNESPRDANYLLTGVKAGRRVVAYQYVLPQNVDSQLTAPQIRFTGCDESWQGQVREVQEGRFVAGEYFCLVDLDAGEQEEVGLSVRLTHDIDDASPNIKISTQIDLQCDGYDADDRAWREDFQEERYPRVEDRPQMSYDLKWGQGVLDRTQGAMLSGQSASFLVRYPAAGSEYGVTAKAPKGYELCDPATKYVAREDFNGRSTALVFNFRPIGGGGDTGTDDMIAFTVKNTADVGQWCADDHYIRVLPIDGEGHKNRSDKLSFTGGTAELKRTNTYDVRVYYNSDFVSSHKDYNPTWLSVIVKDIPFRGQNSIDFDIAQYVNASDLFMKRCQLSDAEKRGDTNRFSIPFEVNSNVPLEDIADSIELYLDSDYDVPWSRRPLDLNPKGWEGVYLGEYENLSGTRYSGEFKNLTKDMNYVVLIDFSDFNYLGEDIIDAEGCDRLTGASHRYYACEIIPDEGSNNIVFNVTKNSESREQRNQFSQNLVFENDTAGLFSSGSITVCDEEDCSVERLSADGMLQSLSSHSNFVRTNGQIATCKIQLADQSTAVCPNVDMPKGNVLYPVLYQSDSGTYNARFDLESDRADVNGDGVVNGSDLTFLLDDNVYQTSLDGDVNGDQGSNVLDYTLILKWFGTGALVK